MLIKKMDAPLDMQIGARFETKKHGYVTVVEYYNTHTVIVAFENTGNIRSITAAKLRSGQLTDRSVPVQSSMVGETIQSPNHGLLTIIQVESDNIVVLENELGDEVRMLLPAVQKLRDKAEDTVEDSDKPQLPTSLSALTKRNKKTKDVNKLLKKMLTDYGK
ncbi:MULTISPECIES: hypothetical protein [Vibrio]|jgi:hypothetical protein|uniref:DUF3391 domain-containing protein n=1 Tax=Vibrio mediterranei TaxID=689 RepID=A0A2S9ZSG0_9VIBR|nr:MULTISPECIES: hypothetical protein [Vibrio]AYV24129.1 hypothetical protein ECB94_22950 [Vibrio mediterranei]MCF4173845.1 hypothetical protein [Vibrio sp. McD22-P3]MCG9626637.1 hypothetical protein [Vibrio mediterranei]MCG9660920.1 hypothetical protein [Vibrio mediterranei]MCG9663810.1 hypothetical protein [Vibrio mediterranei]|eukprot:TRINITY_DN250365_c4_g1_i1.p1 TRINITY_DN250365_c4_g1~~TRINITY_DN250365_c4_g1_i1.p1  ORF type:complete len:162 (-),score=27.12 TRINITY_DN250365_c4_g1_i1:297-782(-)